MTKSRVACGNILKCDELWLLTTSFVCVTWAWSWTTMFCMRLLWIHLVFFFFFLFALASRSVPSFRWFSVRFFRLFSLCLSVFVVQEKWLVLKVGALEYRRLSFEWWQWMVGVFFAAVIFSQKFQHIVYVRLEPLRFIFKFNANKKYEHYNASIKSVLCVFHPLRRLKTLNWVLCHTHTQPFIDVQKSMIFLLPWPNIYNIPWSMEFRHYRSKVNKVALLFRSTQRLQNDVENLKFT